MEVIIMKKLGDGLYKTPCGEIVDDLCVCDKGRMHENCVCGKNLITEVFGANHKF